MLALRNITNQIKAPIFQEMILVSGGGVLHVFLIRTSEDVDPFITSIELRNLQQGMYEQVSAGKMLYFGMRINAGAEDVVRLVVSDFLAFHLWFILIVVLYCWNVKFKLGSYLAVVKSFWILI